VGFKDWLKGKSNKSSAEQTQVAQVEHEATKAQVQAQKPEEVLGFEDSQPRD